MKFMTTASSLEINIPTDNQTENETVKIQDIVVASGAHDGALRDIAYSSGTAACSQH